MTQKQVLGVIACVIMIILCFTAKPPKRRAWREREIEVYKGGTLWKISERFCPNDFDRREWISMVKKINNINGNIKEGQTLIVLEEEKDNENNSETER